ncbi:MAG: hypothetical protein JXC32_21420 [Anaerolineae bacterium]|nr:hypothetical protein [Anaerolineae bacterium]
MSYPPRTVSFPVTDGVPSRLEMTLVHPATAGTLLRVQASGVTMLRSLAVVAVTAYAGNGVAAPSASGTDVDLALVHRFSWEEMQHDWVWHIRTLSMAVVRVPMDLPRGTRIIVRCEPVLEGLDPSGATIADLTWVLHLGKVATPEALECSQVAEPLGLRFSAGPVDHIEAVLKPDGRILVQHLDPYGNPARAPKDGRLAVVLGERRLEVTSAPGTAATAVGGLGVDGLRPESGLRGFVTDNAGRQATTNALPRALDGTPIYFGEFHWHTEFSPDGQRSLQAALTSARDELCLDFAGPADHLGADGTYAHHLPIEQAEICRRFDEPGRFCAIPSAELSARYGHANLVAADFETFLQIIKRFPYELLPVWRERPNSYPLEILSALCPEGRAMIVPHHTNMDSSVRAGVVHRDGRPFWCAMHWPLATPLMRQGVRLVEIVQNRGAFETEAPDPRWRVAWGGFGGSVQTALWRGHRLGFVGGTDNHTGWPTRIPGAAGYGGLTAIQAPQLDGAALFASLYARRCYATSGVRIVADATLNGYPMGSELALAPDAPRLFQIQVHGTAPLDAVQIVSSGAVLADLPVEPDAADFEVIWEDNRPGRPLQDVVYYIRVRQSDGHCAWLSPFFVDLPA